MRDYWNNLSLREKQIVSVGGVFISLLLLYVLIWMPLADKNENLYQQIQQNETLLTWMEGTDKQIQTLEKTASKKPVPFTGSLLAAVQKQLNLSPLVSSLSQLHQVDNNAVQLTFQKVEFDKLMTWLIQITRQQGLIVSQMKVSPADGAGMVSAELVLKAN